jgi:voltage-gated potassium channel
MTHDDRPPGPTDGEELQPLESELKNTGYELFVGAMSILSIVNLALMWAVDDEALDTVLLVMNAVLSAILLVDFVFRLSTAPSKSDYLFRRYGWADLLASLPVQQLKVMRIFRLVRVFRLLRAHGIRPLTRSLLRNRAGSALLSLLLMGILVLEFGSLWILALERHAQDANITTASDAIWYVVVTISTVGYGDQYPVTTPGRVLGALVITLGVAIFGTFTGYLANLFLAPKPDAEESAGTDAAERVAHLRALVAEQQTAIEELASLLGRGRPGQEG